MDTAPKIGEKQKIGDFYPFGQKSANKGLGGASVGYTHARCVGGTHVLSVGDTRALSVGDTRATDSISLPAYLGRA